MQILHGLVNTKRIIQIGLVSILLSGCSTATKIKEVKVPVEVKIPVYKEVTYPYRDYPKLPIRNLDNTSSYKEIVVAYDKSIRLLEYELKYYRSLIYKGDQ